MEALDEGCFVVDCVTIGYAEHPLFRVTFYDKKGNTTTLDRRTAAVHGVHSQELLLRVYRR